MLENARQEARFEPTDETDVAGQRRKYTRYSVDVDVTLGSDHNFYAGFVENMSEGGIFIATHTKKEVGDLIEFSIHLPGFEHPVQGTGEVRWIRMFSEESNVPPGLGIRFRELSEGSLEIIEEFLKTREPLFYDE